MVKISHYEVYTDDGKGWKLEGRFSSDQRYEAINLSREKEQDRKKVKIIRETFDVQENSYTETIEYVSGLGKIKSNKLPVKKTINNADARQDIKNTQKKTKDVSLGGSHNNILIEIIKLIVIEIGRAHV